MFNYSFLCLSDGATIPLPADNDAMALALLGQREHVQLSMAGEDSPDICSRSRTSTRFGVDQILPSTSRET
jgi:hypothetical protein